jgi:prophage regulatory protein
MMVETKDRDPGLRFMRLPAVELATGLKRSSIYAMIGRGEFPRPFKLTSKASAWRSDEIEAWQRDRLADATAPARSKQPNRSSRRGAS